MYLILIEYIVNYSICLSVFGVLPQWLSGKESACNVGNPALVSGLGRSPRGGHGNSLQYSCLENPGDWGAWWAAIYGVAQSWTWLMRLSSSSSRQSWIRPEVRTPIMEETVCFPGDNGDILIVALGLERNREMVETKLGRFRGIGDWELCGAELHLLGA